MKSFIIFFCCILSVGAILAQTVKIQKSTSVTSQVPSATQAATTKTITTKTTTTQAPVLSQAVVSPPDYTKMRIRLPFSTEEKDYFVQKKGHFYVLNGDIIVGDDFPKTMSYSAFNWAIVNFRWPDATIPIIIDPSVYAIGLGDRVHWAISEFNNSTELCLVPRTGESDYIKISFSTDLGSAAGSSKVGRQGGEQSLFLTESATYGTVMHELMHAAGFYHEQGRLDRDEFVKINEDNIEDGKINQFQKEIGSAQSNYDYCSIMHYSSTAFSKNGQPTIECVQNGMTVNCPSCLGNRNGFSDDDIIGIDKFYSNVSRFPCKTNFPNPNQQGQFPNIYPSASQSAMAAFRRSAEIAVKEKPVLEGSAAIKTDRQAINVIKFAGAYPNFHEVRKDNNIIGGTVFLKSTIAQWQDVSLADLGNPSIDDFAARMRATQDYAVRNGYVGGFPNFFHKDYGKGIVCGTVLIGHAGADWRDVPIAELGNPALDDIKARMTSANDYAFKNGYLGGFPTFYHADYGKGIVCGIVLIKKEAGIWKDVIIMEGPK
jgi:hypothetical protein